MVLLVAVLIQKETASVRDVYCWRSQYKVFLKRHEYDKKIARFQVSVF